MLYPQMTATRILISLDGLWRFAANTNNDGEERGWANAIPADREMAVPASWNEQYQELMYFFESGWYEREIEIPVTMQNERIWLRIGAANYLSTVWVNGEQAGIHEGGHLPFVIEMTELVRFGTPNLITIRVDARIAADRLPPGNVEDEQVIGFKGQYPNNYYDTWKKAAGCWMRSSTDALNCLANR